MKHVYILRKTNFTNIQDETSEMIYYNYSEARKAALTVVSIEDKENNDDFDYDPENQPSTFYKEVSPDLWVNKFGLIKIDVVKVNESVVLPKSAN